MANAVVSINKAVKEVKKEDVLIKVKVYSNTYVDGSILVLHIIMFYCRQNSDLIKSLCRAIQKKEAAVTVRVI